MAKELKLYIKVISKAKKGLSKVKTGFKKLVGSIKGGASAMIGALGPIGAAIAGIAIAFGAAFVASIKFLKASTREALKYRSAIAKINAALKATGNAAGLSKEDLKDFREELSLLSGISENVIASAQAMLLTYKDIKGDIFKRTSQAALDMAANLSKVNSGVIDVEGGFQLLAKAINDPTDGLSRLRRVGVVFTKEEKSLIKSLQAAGDVAGAQGVMLKALEEQYGGTAEAMNKADGGLAQLGITWAKVKRVFGEAVFENSDFQDAIQNMIDGLNDAIESGAVESFASDFVAAFTSMAKSLSEFNIAIKPILTSLRVLFKFMDILKKNQKDKHIIRQSLEAATPIEQMKNIYKALDEALVDVGEEDTVNVKARHKKDKARAERAKERAKIKVASNIGAPATVTTSSISDFNAVQNAMGVAMKEQTDALNKIVIATESTSEQLNAEQT